MLFSTPIIPLLYLSLKLPKPPTNHLARHTPGPISILYWIFIPPPQTHCSFKLKIQKAWNKIKRCSCSCIEMEMSSFWQFFHHGLHKMTTSSAASKEHVDGLVQERCNSIAKALELHLSCTNPSIWSSMMTFQFQQGNRNFYFYVYLLQINTLRSRQNGRHFVHDISECIFLKENRWISINI